MEMCTAPKKILLAWIIRLASVQQVINGFHTWGYQIVPGQLRRATFSFIASCVQTLISEKETSASPL